MSQLLPRSPPVESPPRESRVVRLEDGDDQSAAAFEILSSATARAILTALYDEPGPASDIATRVDSSIQNVRYHLDRLTGAELVEVVDTWYSSKGAEMDVYAPTTEPLVITVGDDDRLLADWTPDSRR